MAVSGFYVRRTGYTHVGELMLAVIQDMKNNGFTVLFPASWTPPVDDAGRSAFKLTLEAGPIVDPLNLTNMDNKQPWRVQIQVWDKHTCGICAGSQQSLRTDGSTGYGIAAQKLDGPFGVIGGKYTKGTTLENIQPDNTKIAEGFINRSSRVVLTSQDLSSSFPMTYSLSISPRGIVLAVWEDFTSDSGATAVSWFAIQRPVDRVTGAVVTGGKAPVFAISSTNNLIKRFTVREADVLRPSDPVDATVDSDYNNAIINSMEQVAISEGNKYVISFPSRLNTTRFAYTYELDMLGYTSADVVSENTDIPLQVYDEAEARTYVSLLANGANNTGMRIVALKNGGGISIT